jgi:D-lactate dehydrogenase
LKVAVFSAKPYDREYLTMANGAHGHRLKFFDTVLSPETCLLARGFEIICPFVNDDANETVLRTLAGQGIRLIALRCAGFNNVDLHAAAQLGVRVVNVPAYSPHSVAEHTVGLILALNRKIHRSYARVREGNFALDGLLGFDLYRRTAGIIGTGKIGRIVARILQGFGCRILAHDAWPSEELEATGLRYVPREELFREADVITLHCPLTADTHHSIDATALHLMKQGVMLINTSRGALIDTRAVIAALKSGKVGYLGLDVYEEEADLFFENLSSQVIQDDVFARLLTFPNVIVTGHQGFFTAEALSHIAETTLANITAFARGQSLENEVTSDRRVG